ncbi:putative biphenyl-2,3-diol 1,2-dioxygenase [Hyphomonas neptunium ATCC 15444]|uniref:Putative biphenyl-2,3-diol 1,2-dioxygenase n=2 Tax=Hyphomonas TaxID=85 RepID=Q0C029_HYPNA|nr:MULTISPECIES: VOC family protein [Hyphomonas]ABI77805.1 putative biphenyl-2,3-diol 1,2-dioxygenase [Hyphomonas neptunium ATCC 15444]KCZ86602.1 putative biphenyl-2,3-diol 1,2-dioxygenase [Hyphomonas hirschiana VP5]
MGPDAKETALLNTLKAKTQVIAPTWVSEVVLQTSQFDRMKLWYAAVLGADWAFENKPDPNVAVDNHHGDGGKQVHAKDVRAVFMRMKLPATHTLTFAIFELTHLTHAPTTDPGLNHMQFKHADLTELVKRIEALRDADIHPHRSANHGPITSFYFRDPDENIVEFCLDNFDTPAEMIAFTRSEAFQRNPSGIDLDRDEFLRRFHAGVPRRELLSI